MEFKINLTNINELLGSIEVFNLIGHKSTFDSPLAHHVRIEVQNTDDGSITLSIENDLCHI